MSRRGKEEEENEEEEEEERLGNRGMDNIDANRDGRKGGWVGGSRHVRRV